MPKKLTFETAREKIRNKFSHLDLLYFTSREETATFLDNDFGIFDATYCSILYGWTNHPKRSLYNKTLAAKNKNRINKIKETNIRKYGVSCVLKNSVIKEKIKQTNLESYGAENVFQSEKIKKKIINTNLKRYGTKVPTQNKEIQKKIKQTNLERYGAEYTFQSEKIKTKIKQTNLERHGVNCVTQNKEILQKQIQTKINKNIIHNIDGYCLAEYHRNSKLSKIISYTHLQQMYLKNGYNALKTNFYSKVLGKSRVANKWLVKIEKDLGYSLIREYSIPNTLYRADGYDPNTNTVYEFYGDFWHGNLENFVAEEVNPITKTSFQELYNKTINRQSEIKLLGYNFIYIWESKFIQVNKLA